MKVFISQPMTGRTKEEILMERQAITNIVKRTYGEDTEIIDSYDESNDSYAEKVGRSIGKMLNADLVAFSPSNKKTRQFRLERACCMSYGIEYVIIQEDIFEREYCVITTAQFQNGGAAQRADNLLKQEDYKPYEPLLSENDPVNHPSHYTDGKFECIDEMVIMFGAKAVYYFCICNAYKYQCRAGKKDGNSAEQDLAKKDWYLTKAKELMDDIPAF